MFWGMRFAVPFWGPEKRFVLSGRLGWWFYSRKTSRREVFLECTKWKFVRELFSYKSSLFFNPNFGLKNSPAKALER